MSANPVREDEKLATVTIERFGYPLRTVVRTWAADKSTVLDLLEEALRGVMQNSDVVIAPMEIEAIQ